MILDTLIYDRTQADINRVNYLHGKVSLKTATVSEFEEWQTNLKGASNYSDLNRVANVLEYLVPVLQENGYYPHFTRLKKDWNKLDIRYENLMSDFMYNVKQVATGSLLGIPNSFDGFTYVHQNNLEKALKFTQQYMENKNLVSFHSGMFASGNIGGLRR